MQAADRRAGKPFLLGRFGVARDLLQRRMTSDGGDLVRRAAGLGEAARSSLPQTMRHAIVWQARRSNLVRHEVAEAIAGERLAEARCQDRLDFPLCRG